MFQSRKRKAASVTVAAGSLPTLPSSRLPEHPSPSVFSARSLAGRVSRNSIVAVDSGSDIDSSFDSGFDSSRSIRGVNSRIAASPTLSTDCDHTLAATIVRLGIYETH